MDDKIGNLLSEALRRVDAAADASEANVIAAHVSGADTDGRLPVVIKLPTQRPNRGEGWKAYRERIDQMIAPTREFLKEVINAPSTPLISANALAAITAPTAPAPSPPRTRSSPASLLP